jgi:hypothetical protein
MTTATERHYPMNCRSLYCGEVEGPTCQACVHRAELDDFRAWLKATGAVQADPVWSPAIYVAPAAA